MRRTFRRALLPLAAALMLLATAAAAEAPVPRVTFSPGGGGGMPSAAQSEFYAGTRAVRAGDWFYTIEVDGIYRFDGPRRYLVAEGAFDRYGSIVTDGETVYVTRTDEYGAVLLRIGNGVATEMAVFETSTFSRIGGVIDNKIYLLFTDPEDEWDGMHVVETNMNTGEEELLLSHIGNTQLWKNNLIVSGFRTDVGPQAYVLVDRDGNTATLGESTLYATGRSDGIYYWVSDGDEERGIPWSYIELLHIGADGVESLLRVDSPGASAWPGESFDTFSTFYYMPDDDEDIVQYVIDHLTLEVWEIYLPAGQYAIWFEDGGDIYCFGYESEILYALDEEGFASFMPMLDLAGASVYEIVNGYVYYTGWDAGAPMEAELIASD